MIKACQNANNDLIKAGQGSDISFLSGLFIDNLRSYRDNPGFARCPRGTLHLRMQSKFIKSNGGKIDMRKIIILAAMLVLLALFPASSAFAGSFSGHAVFYVGQYSYTIAEKTYYMPATTINKGGRVFVPVRYLAVALDIPENKIIWNPFTRTVIMKGNGIDVVMTEGGKTIYVGGKAKKIDVAPFIYKDRVYLPARYLAEAFGLQVVWDDRLQAVIVGTPGLLPQKPAGLELRNIVETLRQYLSEQKGLPIYAIVLRSAEAVNWPDTSLGCPEPGKMYAQVITPGYRIVLSSGKTDFAFHTDKNGHFVLAKNQSGRAI